MKRQGWTRLSAPGNKLEARWRHDASGWEVWHCGHPTASWPYAAADPEHPGSLTATHTGRGFRTLTIAFDQIEAVLRGDLVTVEDGPCKHGYRRIICKPGELPSWLREQRKAAGRRRRKAV